MTVQHLGDPHLGRVFTKGVPIHRRGEREQLVRDDFLHALMTVNAPTHVCLGDLFDAPQVDYATVRFAYQAYRRAAAEYPGTTFYIIQGNHDDSRDLDEVTAWDLFCDLVEHLPNVVPVTQPVVNDQFAIFPWHPTKPAAEMVERCWAAEDRPAVAYGHWDVDPRSASHNLIPIAELAALGVTTVYTGHVHKPDTFVRDGVTVHVVGSMQPYAQGEDGDQSAAVSYITVSLDELGVLGPALLQDSCVRLILQPGEQAPETIPDCRSFSVERTKALPEDAPADVSMEGFDTTSAARAALDAHEIIPEVRGAIDAKIAEAFGAGG